jgi:1-phosphofructokinase family hexose kinase
VILAAGLTPAWQQILSFDQFVPGEVNRAIRVEWCASGKVLNVGMALHHLGARAQTLSLIGGRTGDAIRGEFASRNIPARWIESQTPTRTCTTILDGQTHQTTELVENSAPIAEEDLQLFRGAFQEEAARAEWVVLSGSLPVGVPATLYRELMRDCPGKVILDVRGTELSQALTERPFLVKPNRAELARTVGRDLSTEEETLDAMRELNSQGAQWVVVTHGAKSVLASHETEAFRLLPPQVPVVNPIACGDCFAAGLAWGFSQGHSPMESLRLGVAAAAENLSQVLPARLNPERVRKIAETVRSDVISG